MKYNTLVGRSGDTKAWKRDKMHQNSALKGLKMHAWTARSDAFPRSWSTRLRCKISVPDLIWRGLCGQMARLMADFGGNKGQFPKSER